MLSSPRISTIPVPSKWNSTPAILLAVSLSCLGGPPTMAFLKTTSSSDLGFDLSNGMPHLIYLRFADDILLCARSAMEVGKLLDSLVAELSEVGLLLNADKTVFFLTAAQRGVKRKGSSRLARSSGRRQRLRPAAAGAPRRWGRPWPAALRGSCWRQCWPQRSTSGPNGVARHGPMQRGSGRAKQALSHVLKHEERFGSLCSSGPPPRAQGLQACIVLAARTLGKCDSCAPRLGRGPGQAPCQRRGGGSSHAGLDTPTWRQRPLAHRGRMGGRWQRPPSVGHQWWAAPGLTRGGRRLLQPALPLRGRFRLRPFPRGPRGARGPQQWRRRHGGRPGCRAPHRPTQAAEQGDTEDVVAHVVFRTRG